MIHYTGKLGRWLDNQRQFKKGHGPSLQTDREQKLQTLVDQGMILLLYILVYMYTCTIYRNYKCNFYICIYVFIRNNDVYIHM